MTTVVHSSATTSSYDDDVLGNNATCLICCSDDLSRHRGITPCNHNSVCAPCHTRLRYLHSDLRCPICKTSNDRVVVDVDNATHDGQQQYKLYAEYGIWGDDELGQDFMLREDVKMFFRHDYHEQEIVPLFRLACQFKDCSYVGKGMKGLTEHLRTKHTASFCDLCVDAKRDFISRLPRFRPEQLKLHQKKGEGKGSGFTGHPVCEFCRPLRFYDLTKLHEHLNKDHYKCHVCENQGQHNQFFKNYDKLSLHFDKQHFLCHDPQCLAARFVVFENEIDLRAHEVSTHGAGLSSNSSTKIQLEFRVRRTGYDGSGYEDQSLPTQDDFQFGLNGEAFVPDSLPGGEESEQAAPLQENEPEISDPVHAARTAEMRQHASRVRQQQGLTTTQASDEFPELGPANSSSQPMVGWSGDASRTIRTGNNNQISSQEAFPSLSSTVRPSPQLALARRMAQQRGAMGRKKAAAAPSRQFAAMATSSYTQPRCTIASNNTPQQRNRTAALTADNFPSLGNASSTKNNGYAAQQSVNSNRNRAAAALTADNFPSLGNTSSTNNNGYAAAQNYSRKMQSSPALTNGSVSQQKARPLSSPAKKKAPPTAADFPSLGGSAPSYTAAQNFAKKQQQKCCTIQSGPTAAQTLAKNVIMPPTAASRMDPKEQLSALKSILGNANYKLLKTLTKDFAMDQCAHEQYVDQVSTCFAEGKSDRDFWNFIPALIQSCPENSEGRNRKAMEYMASIRASSSDARDSEYNTGYGYTPPVPSRPFAPATNQRVSTTQYKVPQSKKKAAVWGSGTNNAAFSKTTTMLSNSKLPPGTSVARAAAQEKIGNGNATSFMARTNLEEKKDEATDEQYK